LRKLFQWYVKGSEESYSDNGVEFQHVTAFFFHRNLVAKNKIADPDCPHCRILERAERLKIIMDIFTIPERGRQYIEHVRTNAHHEAVECPTRFGNFTCHDVKKMINHSKECYDPDCDCFFVSGHVKAKLCKKRTVPDEPSTVVTAEVPSKPLLTTSMPSPEKRTKVDHELSVKNKVFLINAYSLKKSIKMNDTTYEPLGLLDWDTLGNAEQVAVYVTFWLHCPKKICLCRGSCAIISEVNKQRCAEIHAGISGKVLPASDLKHFQLGLKAYLDFENRLHREVSVLRERVENMLKKVSPD
jgi:hypothetical protein